MKSLEAGTRTLLVKLSFRAEVTVNCETLSCRCTEENEVIVPIVSAFNITVRQLNLRFEPPREVRAQEPFVLLVVIECICPWFVYIDTSVVSLVPSIDQVDKPVVSQLDKIELQSRGKAIECMCLVSSKPRSDPLAMGSYSIVWRRKCSPPHVPSSECTVSLPSIAVASPYVYVEAEFPACGWTRSPLSVAYVLRNYTCFIQEFELAIDSSDAFMFAGQKQLHFRLMPRASHRLVYNLYPLLAGYVALPRLHLTLTQNTNMQATVDDLLEMMLPTHIFIMPKAKLMPIEAT